MGRVYVGVRNSSSGDCNVYLEQDGQRYRLTHQVRGNRAGFCWDRAGPDSRAVAKTLLWKTTDARPKWSVYRLFASERVT